MYYIMNIFIVIVVIFQSIMSCLCHILIFFPILCHWNAKNYKLENVNKRLSRLCHRCCWGCTVAPTFRGSSCGSRERWHKLCPRASGFFWRTLTTHRWTWWVVKVLNFKWSPFEISDLISRHLRTTIRVWFQISVLLPLMENKKLMIPGREDCIEVAPGFQFFATRR